MLSRQKQRKLLYSLSFKSIKTNENMFNFGIEIIHFSVIFCLILYILIFNQIWHFLWRLSEPKKGKAEFHYIDTS